MASFKTRQQQAFEDLQVTKDELNSIGEAFKSEEFRNLFTDYINEITDPENQKLYEKEITELERQRGNDVTFIRPVPGYVIKTSLDGEKKAFINVCCNDNVKKPTAVPEEGGLHWSIPFTQAPPRDDFDNKKNTCYVFDVVFHPDTIQMAKENAKFKEMVSDTAMNAVEENFKVKLDKQNVRYPKIQFKGLQQPTVIRRKSKKPPVTSSEDSDQGIFEIPNYPYPPVSDEVPSPKEVKLPSVKKTNAYTTPKYLIKQRSNIDIQDCTNSTTAKINAAIPNELVIEVELPLIKSATDVTLDVTQKSLKLISEKPAKYKLDITLPYIVDEEKGNAKFDTSIKKLIITLIVNRDKHCPKVPFEMSREDSGVDSDVGSGSLESSSIDGSEDEPAECQQQSPETSENENVKSLDNLSDLIIENKVKSDEADNGYRTNKSDEFLNSDKHYSYPHYDVNILENILAFTFHTKNVEPDSIDSKFLDNDCGFHLKFSSIGSGFFPIHYAFCVKFPKGVIVDNENLNVEVWDNNVIAQVTINGCDKDEIDEYFSGVDENVLKKHSLPNPVKLLKLVQQETENISTVSTSTIEVIKFEEDNVVLEIKSKNPSPASPLSSTHDDIKEENTETNINNVEQEIENITTEVKKKVKTRVDHDETNSAKVKFLKNYNENKGVEKKQSMSSANKISFSPGTKTSPRSLARTFSESHSDKSVLKPYRGILKVGRSLSESNADDYSLCSSSVENTDPNGLKTKKTVRFSESISKKTYRTNSSILGQRKKNQRKARNKKRAQERRASESENSEGEFDDLKNKVQDNVFKSDDEMSETQSDVSQSDISQSDVSESDDGMPKNDKPDVMSLSKRNPHKKGGKKSARKSANTAKMAFTNNLMFDLDM